MTRLDRFVLRFLAVVFVLLAIIAFPNIHGARQRSKQKQTMVTLRDIATRMETGITVTAGEDGWGHPLRIHQTGKHYTIRAAAADGRFDTRPPVGGTTDFDSDVVYSDGGFTQHPEGI